MTWTALILKILLNTMFNEPNESILQWVFMFWIFTSFRFFQHKCWARGKWRPFCLVKSFATLEIHNLSIIAQRSNLKTGLPKKQSKLNFPKNEHFFHTCAYQGVKNVRFSENLACFVLPCVSGGNKCSFFGKFSLLCFLETPILRFTLLPNLSVSEHAFLKNFPKIKHLKTILPFIL